MAEQPSPEQTCRHPDHRPGRPYVNRNCGWPGCDQPKNHLLDARADDPAEEVDWETWGLMQDGGPA